VKPKQKEHEVSLRVINAKDHDVNFQLEPWGDVINMAPQDQFVVHLSSPEYAEPEVEMTEDSIVVYGWTGCLVRVTNDGNEIVNYSRARVPAMP
jgi:hypothetical protein